MRGVDCVCSSDVRVCVWKWERSLYSSVCVCVCVCGSGRDLCVCVCVCGSGSDLCSPLCVCVTVSGCDPTCPVTVLVPARAH